MIRRENVEKTVLHIFLYFNHYLYLNMIFHWLRGFINSFLLIKSKPNSIFNFNTISLFFRPLFGPTDCIFSHDTDCSFTAIGAGFKLSKKLVFILRLYGLLCRLSTESPIYKYSVGTCFGVMEIWKLCGFTDKSHQWLGLVSRSTQK